LSSSRKRTRCFPTTSVACRKVGIEARNIAPIANGLKPKSTMSRRVQDPGETTVQRRWSILWADVCGRDCGYISMASSHTAFALPWLVAMSSVEFLDAWTYVMWTVPYRRVGIHFAQGSSLPLTRPVLFTSLTITCTEAWAVVLVAPARRLCGEGLSHRQHDKVRVLELLILPRVTRDATQDCNPEHQHP
jgi:hypothetical protein